MGHVDHRQIIRFDNISREDCDKALQFSLPADPTRDDLLEARTTLISLIDYISESVSPEDEQDKAFQLLFATRRLMDVGLMLGKL